MEGIMVLQRFINKAVFNETLTTKHFFFKNPLLRQLQINGLIRKHSEYLRYFKFYEEK